MHGPTVSHSVSTTWSYWSAWLRGQRLDDRLCLETMVIDGKAQARLGAQKLGRRDRRPFEHPPGYVDSVYGLQPVAPDRASK